MQEGEGIPRYVGDRFTKPDLFLMIVYVLVVYERLLKYKRISFTQVVRLWITEIPTAVKHRNYNSRQLFKSHMPVANRYTQQFLCSKRSKKVVIIFVVGSM